MIDLQNSILSSFRNKVWNQDYTIQDILYSIIIRQTLTRGWHSVKQQGKSLHHILSSRRYGRTAVALEWRPGCLVGNRVQLGCLWTYLPASSFLHHSRYKWLLASPGKFLKNTHSYQTEHWKVKHAESAAASVLFGSAEIIVRNWKGNLVIKCVVKRKTQWSTSCM